MVAYIIGTSACSHGKYMAVTRLWPPRSAAATHLHLINQLQIGHGAQAGAVLGAQALKANSSDVYPSRPPHVLPDGTFALHFDYPVEGLAIGDYLAVCASLLAVRGNFCQQAL